MVDPHVWGMRRSTLLFSQVLTVLEHSDSREAENKLVMLLDFDKFDLIKMLLANQAAVVWCTKLARAQVRVLTRVVQVCGLVKALVIPPTILDHTCT